MEQSGRLQAKADTLQWRPVCRCRFRRWNDKSSVLRAEFDQISQQEIQEQLAQVEEQIKMLQDEVAALEKEIALAFRRAAQRNQRPGRRTPGAIDRTAGAAQRLQPLLLNYQQIRSNLLFWGNQRWAPARVPISARCNCNLPPSLYQRLYLNLLNNLESLQLLRLQYTPNIDQIEPAAPPERPVRPSKTRYLILGVLTGVALLGALAVAIEFLDDTLKSPKDVTQFLGLPTLASIQEFDSRRLKGEEIFVLKHPKSPVADATACCAHGHPLWHGRQRG